MRIETVPYTHPDAALLIEEIQGEYVRRYGSPDESPVDTQVFLPPAGAFLVGYDEHGLPVACGGWRRHGEQDAELKRMYVRPRARGRGAAREVLATLEDGARRAGLRRMILETGTAQPEAIALYRSSGYTPIEAFGFYAAYSNAVHLGKDLGTVQPPVGA